MHFCVLRILRKYSTQCAVKYKEMSKILKDTGVGKKDTMLISNLYWNQKAAVRVGAENTDWIEIKREVKQ